MAAIGTPDTGEAIKALWRSLLRARSVPGNPIARRAGTPAYGAGCTGLRSGGVFPAYHRSEEGLKVIGTIASDP